jgi:uncharacterized membrane protein
VHAAHRQHQGEIMTPAMIVTWILGLWLAWQSGYYAAPWLQAKFALVLAMSGAPASPPAGPRDRRTGAAGRASPPSKR